MRHYLLAFAVGNYISFFAWLLVPAAPPWYMHAHGCAIDTTVAANPAGLTRVDELLGISYFASFYGRASAVFGAMPSMHCAYPLIGLLTAWRSVGVRSRLVHVLYTVLMSVAAMYLDHHWAVDVLAGWLTALASVAISGLWLRFRARQPSGSLALARESSPRRFDRPTPVPATFQSD
jgi:membrane-associated phospholipid phosphatase